MRSSLAAPRTSFEALFRATEVYRRYATSQSLLHFEMFLLVAARGPIIGHSISEALGTPEATVSVGLAHLGAGSPKYGKSLGAPPKLVARVAHPADARMKLAALTPRGNQLVEEMRATLTSVK